MSLWTLQIYDVLKNYALPETNLSFDELIENTYTDFFNFDFPWYSEDETSKNDFKKLFLLHNIMNYIGQETLELFRASLACRLREIMPYYSELYTTFEMEWLKNIDVTYEGSEDHTKNIDGTSKASSNTNTNYQAINSDNPQVTVATNDYASDMQRSEGVGKSSGEEVTTSNENYSGNDTRKEHGYRNMSRGELVKQMRETIVNINLEIINKCSDLFLGVW